MSAPLVILGAGGRVGRLLRGAARATGVRDVLFVSRRDGPGIGATWDPLAGDGALARLCRGAGAVLNLAGTVPGGGDPALNTALARAAAEAVQEAGVPRLLLASSAAVYGQAPAPLTEDGAAAPLSPYGQAKLEMERAVQGPGICALRIGNVAGADALLGPHWPGAPNALVLDRFASGHGPLRSYVGPIALLQILRQLATASHLPQVLNCAQPPALRMEALLSAAGWTWQWRSAPATAIEDATLDLTRLEALIPLPQTSAEVMIDELSASHEALT